MDGFRPEKDRQLSLDEVARKAEQDFELPNGILRSLGIEESHGFNQWDESGNLIKSGTGPTGALQFTKSTAKQYGINRDDPIENVLGGAAYLRDNYKALRPLVDDEDEAWLAAAVAHNRGLGAVKGMINGRRFVPTGKDSGNGGDTLSYATKIAGNWLKYRQGGKTNSPAPNDEPQTQIPTAGDTTPPPNVQTIPAQQFNDPNALDNLNFEKTRLETKFKAAKTLSQKRRAKQELDGVTATISELTKTQNPNWHTPPSAAAPAAGQQPPTNPSPTFPFGSPAVPTETAADEQKIYTRRDLSALPEGSAYFPFEKTGKTDAGDQYLGMTPDGKHRFKNTDGDELELDEKSKTLSPTSKFTRTIKLVDGTVLTRGEALPAGGFKYSDDKKEIYRATDNGISPEKFTPPRTIKLNNGDEAAYADGDTAGLNPGQYRYIDPDGKPLLVTSGEIDEQGNRSIMAAPEFPDEKSEKARVGKTSTAGKTNQTVPNADDGYSDWLAYQKNVDANFKDSKESRAKYAADLKSAPEGSVQVGAEITSPADAAAAQQGADISDDLRAAEAQKAKAEKFFADKPMVEAGSDAEILDNGSAGSVPVDLSKKPAGVNAGRWLLKQALLEVAPKYGYTSADVDKYIDGSTLGELYYDKLTDEDLPGALESLTAQHGDTNVRVDLTNHNINDILQIRKGSNNSDDILRDSIHPELRTQIGMDETTSGAGLEKSQSNALIERSRAAEAAKDPLLAQAEEEARRSPLSDGTPESIQRRFQELKDIALSDNTKENLTGFGQMLQNDSATGSMMQNRIAGGVIGALGDVSHALAGVGRGASGIVNTLGEAIGVSSETLKYLGTDNWKAFSQLGTGAAIISNESAKNLGFAGTALNVAGRAVVDVPKYVGLTMLTGGSGVLAFAADDLLKSAGRGESIEKIGVAAAKGAIMGALFHGASKLGQGAEDGLVGSALNAARSTASVKASLNSITKIYKPAADIELLAKLAGNSVRVGAIAGGTFAVAKAEGSDNTDAFHQAAMMTLFDLVMSGKKIGEAADLSGKVIRLWKDGNYSDFMFLGRDKAALTRETSSAETPETRGGVEIYDVTGKVPKEAVQAEILSADNKKANDSIENARDITPAQNRGRQLKSSDEAISDNVLDLKPLNNPPVEKPEITKKNDSNSTVRIDAGNEINDNRSDAVANAQPNAVESGKNVVKTPANRNEDATQQINAGNAPIKEGDKVRYFDAEENRIRTGTAEKVHTAGSNGGSNILVRFDDKNARGYDNRMVAPNEIENLSVAAETQNVNLAKAPASGNEPKIPISAAVTFADRETGETVTGTVQKTKGKNAIVLVEGKDEPVLVKKNKLTVVETNAVDQSATNAQAADETEKRATAISPARISDIKGSKGKAQPFEFGQKVSNSSTSEPVSTNTVSTNTVKTIKVGDRIETTRGKTGSIAEIWDDPKHGRMFAYKDDGNGSEQQITADMIKMETAADEKAKPARPKKEKTEHAFSTTQLNLPEEHGSRIKKLARKLIYAEDLAADGFETNPHATVKFGLHTNKAETLRPIIESHQPFEITLGKVEIFPGKGKDVDYDVVKIGVVDSPELHALNKKISDGAKNTDTHPAYQPHITLAYVKKGKGAKYAGSAALEGTKIPFSEVHFSDRQRNQTAIQLKGKAENSISTENAISPEQQRKLDKAGKIANRKERSRAKADPTKNSLWQYVKNSGGIRADRTDSKKGKTGGNIDRLSVKEGGRIGVLNKDGKDAESMAFSAWEAGYLTDVFPTAADINGNRFLEYVEADTRSPQHFSHYNTEFFENGNVRDFEKGEEEILARLGEFTYDDRVLPILQEIEKNGQPPNAEQLKQLVETAEKYGLSGADVDSTTKNLREAAQVRSEAQNDAQTSDVPADSGEGIFEEREIDESEPDGDVDMSFDFADEEQKQPSKPAQSSFDQTDLFGNKVSAKTEQTDLFDTSGLKSERENQIKKETVAAYGKKTADYLSQLEQSADSDLRRVAGSLIHNRNAVISKGVNAKSLIEDAADALDLYTLAKHQKNTVREQLAQGRLDAAKYNDRAVEFATFMQARKFSARFDDALLEVKKSEKTTLVAEKPESDGNLNYGTVEKPNALKLAEAFSDYFKSGKGFSSIVEARKFAGNLLGGRVEGGTVQEKQIQEIIELGVVLRAREIAQDAKISVSQKYDSLVELYGNQPNLSGRTSTSMREQAYSTPAPLAFIASEFAGINNKTTVYEPTAGNGMLLIGANSENVTANELNDDRFARLQDALPGATLTHGDVLTNQTKGKFDAVITNPPFGSVKDEKGNAKTFQISAQYKTLEIDHAIALKALESMKDDGKAVLIVGSVMPRSEQSRSDAYNGKSKRAFFFSLYNEYNVTNHFTVDGALYQRQGAAFPVDVIVIDGRGKSKLELPAADVPKVYNSWADLKGVLNGKRNSSSLDADKRAVVSDAEPGSVSNGDGDSASGERRDGRLGLLGSTDKQSAEIDNGGGASGIRDGRDSSSTGDDESGSRRTARRGDGSRSSDTEQLESANPFAPNRSDEGVAAPLDENQPESRSDNRGNRLGELDKRADDGAERIDGSLATKQDGDAAIDAAFDELFGNQSETKLVQPHTKTVDTVSTAATKPTTTKSATKSETSAPANLDEAAELLRSLLGGDETLKMAQVSDDTETQDFNEATYQKMKLAFAAAYEHFKDKISDLQGIALELLKTLHTKYNFSREQLAKLRPYLSQFVVEAKNSASTVGEKVAEKVTKVKAEIPADEKAKENDLQVTYTPKSGVKSENVLVPVNMQLPVRQALDALESAVGDIDQYVAGKLDLPAGEISEYFNAEQMDALGLALFNIEAGKGFIIGDQTGLGKGRVVAGILKYAMLSGKTPIFVTEKPNLYKDIYRDLQDIGVSEPRLLMTNGGQKVFLDNKETNFIKTAESKKHAELLQSIIDEGKLVDHDVVVTTYNQMQTLSGGERTIRHDFLETLAPNSIIVFDESHNAGGTDAPGKQAASGLNRADFARLLARLSKGVMFSSATYAKRPEVMSLYASTDIHLAVSDISKLPDIINEGGVPLQQTVAAMLAEAGQYIRRERSFDGIEYNLRSVEVDKTAAEGISSVMRMIQAFDGFKNSAVGKIDKQLKREGKKVTTDGSTGAAGAKSTNFTSLMHNLIDQMLVTMKVDAVADEVIKSVKAGEKPVVTLSNTMGSFIENYADDYDLKTGDAIDLDFGNLLLRYLDRSREVREKTAYGDSSKRVLTDDELGERGVEFFQRTKDAINAMDWGAVPVSPIDYLHNKLHEAGITTGEVTGRTQTIDYSGDVPVYKLRRQKEISPQGRNNTIAAFNSGTTDVLILNQAGSTGLSAHASIKEIDRRRRHMFILQAEKNIDTHMQMLGRINRTGQIDDSDPSKFSAPEGKPSIYGRPRYSQMIADIPAEIRPAAVLAKKMASLNANTTGSKDSKVSSSEIFDFMNEYGDKVIADLMYDNPDVHGKLGEPLKINSDGNGFDTDGAARTATGRIPLLTIAEQEEIYERIQNAYSEHIQQLDALGENALQAVTMDLDAKTVASKEIFPKSGESPFQQSAQAETVDIKRQGKPFTKEQVLARLSQELERDLSGVSESNYSTEVAHYGAEKLRGMVSEAVRDFERYRDEILDETPEDKLDGERAKLQMQGSIVNARINHLPVGAKIQIESKNFGTMNGVVLEIKRGNRTKNPLAPGDWKITFALADNMRQLTLPLSKLANSNSFNTQIARDESISDGAIVFSRATSVYDKLGARTDVLDAFDNAQGSTRETRTMITGNLLAGFGIAKKGQFVYYTDADGNHKQGVLMPKNFNIEKTLSDAPVIFPTVQHAIDFVKAQSSNLLATTTDGTATATQSWGKFSIGVPASKAAGGSIFLNPQIIAAAGQDFVKSGSRMMLRDLDEKRAYRVMEAISDASDMSWQTNSYKSVAQKIIDAGKPQNADETLKMANAQSAEIRLAPNGKPSNLTPFQHAQVRTAEFKKWFGDWENNPEDASQMLDENGEPRMFHHGSKNQFDTYSKDKFASATDAGWLGEGFYFYDNEYDASQYGDITSVYLNIKEPYYAEVEDNRRLSELDDVEESRQFSDDLKGNGYDGVYYNGDLRGETVVFEPNQIKSAIANNGEFSPENDSILKKARLPEIESAIREIEGADLTELLKVVDPNAGLSSDGHIVDVKNVETFEIVRRAVEAYDLQVNPSKTERSRFDGLFLDPKQLDGVIKILRKGAEFGSKNSGLEMNDRRKLHDIADTLKEAAKVDGTVIVKIFDDAIPHEEIHRLGFTEAADKLLAARHGDNLKTLAAHPTVQKIKKGAFSKLYRGASDAAIVEEANAWLLSGQREDLNKIQRSMGLPEITREEAADFLADWQISYHQANATADMTKFAAISEYAAEIYEQTKRIERANRESGQGNDQSSGSDADGQSGVKSRDAENSGTSGIAKSAVSDKTESLVENDFDRSGEQKKRGLPGTMREGGLAANDALYDVFGNSEAKEKAQNLLTDLGLNGAVKLLESTETYDKTNAVMSFMVQAALRDESIKAARDGDEKRADELRLKALELADRHASLATKAGQFIQAAAMVAQSVDGVIYHAQKIAKSKGKELSAKAVAQLTKAGTDGEGILSELSRLKAENRRLAQNVKDLREGRVRRRSVLAPRANASVVAQARKSLSFNVDDLIAGLKTKFAAKDETSKMALAADTNVERASPFDDLTKIGASILLDVPTADIKRTDFIENLKSLVGDDFNDQMPEIFGAAYAMRNDLLKEARVELERTKLAAENPDLDAEGIEALRLENQAARAKRLASGALNKKLAHLYLPEKAKATLDLIQAMRGSGASPSVTDLAERILTKEINPNELSRAQRVDFLHAEKLLEDAKAHASIEKRERDKEILGDKKLLRANKIENFKQCEAFKIVQQDLANQFRRLREGAVKCYAKETMKIVGESRSVLASGDLSGSLRQGFYFSVTDTGQNLKGNETWSSILNRNHGDTENAEREILTGAFKAQFKGAFNGEKFAEVITAIEAHPEFDLMKKSGIEFAEAGQSAFSLTKAEENIRTEYAKKIPLLKSWLGFSERTYAGFLDQQRALIASQIFEELAGRGATFETHEKEFKAAAYLINIATGRGQIGDRPKLQSAIDAFGGMFFAPSYLISRFQLLAHVAGLDMPSMPPMMRRIALKKVARFHMLISLPMLALALAGLSAYDPDDPDFMKIRVGEKARYEILGGMQPTLRYLGKMAKQAFLLTHGDTDAVSMAKEDVRSTGRFVRGKLAPVPSLGVDWFYQKDFKGDPFAWDTAVTGRITPIVAHDFYEAYEQDGLYGSMFVIPSIFGVGASYYKDKPLDAKYAKKKTAEDLKRRVDSGKTSVEDAKSEIKAQVQSGELTVKQGVAAKKTIGMSAPERTAANLDAASDTDFVKIETFAKDVPAENREKVYTVLWKKYQNKLKGNVDAATRSQADKLKGIIEKNFAPERAAAKARAAAP